jgi:enoyl-CoA hydratase
VAETHFLNSSAAEQPDKSDKSAHLFQVLWPRGSEKMSRFEKSHTHILVERQDAVATLRVENDNGPALLSSRVIGELGNAIEQIGGDPLVRFVVLRGDGQTFLAGEDIHELAHFSEDDALAYARHANHVIHTLERLPQVTVAAVNGHALGAGCALATACDFRLMVSTARIGHPESALGLIPAWGTLERLPRLVGPIQAKRLIFCGRSIDADEAERIGLVDQVVPRAEDLDTMLTKWFEQLANGSPAAIARIKRALLNGDETNQFALCFSCSDAKEGVRAFLEKRTPFWSKWADSGKTSSLSS